MPTTTVNATLQGRAIFQTTQALINWKAQVRDASSSTVTTTYTSANSVGGAIRVYLISSRGSFSGFCGRIFLFFDDLDTATGGGTITAATLKVYNPSSSNAIDTVPVESTAWNAGTDTTLDAADYSNLDQSVTYSNTKLTWGGGYNDYTLNATAISAMNTDGYLNTAVIEGEHDQGNTNPTTGATSETATVRFLDSSNPIKLELTYTPAGYGHDINGVSSGNIVSVNGVATADIVSFIGVS